MKKILPVVLLLALLGAAYVYFFMYNKEKTDLSTVSANVTISAPELLAQYAADEAKANALYLNKVIAVKGSIAESPSADDKGIVSIMLKGDDTGGVNCELSEAASKEPINSYQAGQEITIKGTCSGSNGIDVVLSQCVVAK